MTNSPEAQALAITGQTATQPKELFAAQTPVEESPELTDEDGSV